MTTAIANQVLGNVNQVTPFGNLTYAQSGSTSWTDPSSGKVYKLPQFTATQTLSPQQQRLNSVNEQADINMATLARDQSQRLGSVLGKPMNLNGAPDVTAPQLGGVRGAGPIASTFGKSGAITKTYGTDFSAERQRVEEALMSRLNPSLTQERDALTAQLSNQGIKLGTEAYDRAMQNHGQQANDARMAAILGAGEEQSRLTGMEAQRAAFQNSAQQQAYSQMLGRASFANDAQQQRFGQNFAAAGFRNDAAQQAFENQRGLRSDYMQEQYAARNQPINEISALLGGAQVQSPSFVGGGGTQMPTVDIAGLKQAKFANRMNIFGQRNAGYQDMMGGLFGLGRSVITAGMG